MTNSMILPSTPSTYPQPLFPAYLHCFVTLYQSSESLSTRDCKDSTLAWSPGRLPVPSFLSTTLSFRQCLVPSFQFISISFRSVAIPRVTLVLLTLCEARLQIPIKRLPESVPFPCGTQLQMHHRPKPTSHR